MADSTRRGFLRAAGGVTAVGTGVALGVGSVNAAVTVTGRVVAHDGTPVANRVIKNYGDGGFDAYTDDDGRFSAETKANGRMMLTLYKGNRSTLVAPVKNGVPHVYVLGKYDSKDGNDLGTLSVPRGHLVRLRALDSDGNPVPDATPGARHQGAGLGEYYASTRADGWAYIRDADFDGLELTQTVQLSMDIPVDGGEFSMEERVTVDSPMEVVFQVGGGVSISKGERKTKTATRTATEDASSQATPTSTATREPATATPSRETATTSSQTPTSTTTPASPTSTPGTKRGFISNGDTKTDLGPLEDPLFLTVVGFVLSVAGIAHQMVRGY